MRLTAFGTLLLIAVLSTPLGASTPLLLESQGGAAVPRIDVLASHSGSLDLRFTLPALEVDEIVHDGETYQRVSIPGGGFSGETGGPGIPTFTRLLQIPDRSGVTVRATIEEETDLPGYMLDPLQGYEEEPFVVNAEAYRIDSFGPEPAAMAGPPGILRDLRIVPITFQPVRFNPARGVLKVASRIRVEVTFEGEDPRNARGSSPPRPRSPSFDRLYEQIVVNYEGPAPEVGMAPGAWVLISPDDATVLSLLQPLIDWRRRQGYTVRLATTSETGTDAQSIKDWIQNAYDNWEIPPEYICLAGDGTTPYMISTFFESLSPYHGEGDHPYVLLEGDDPLADAHVGRLSFSTTTELEAIVNKIIGYETDPPLDEPGWFNRACLVGDPYDSGYSTVLVQQWIKDRLRDVHAYTDIDTIYEAPFVDQMLPALNQGDTIFSYRGYYGMSGWTNSHTYALQNGRKLPFMVAITCGTGSFASGTSRSEGFLRANGGPANPRGGIAGIGTATIGTHTRYNNCIHYGIFRGLLWDDQFTLGSALTRGKLEMYLNYQQSEPNQVMIWSHWNNLMGDPALECWTGYPEELTVDHPTVIPVGANAVTVIVERAGIPEPSAQVCLFCDGQTHAVGLTDADGSVTLPITASDQGEMLITVTKHNRHPFLGSIPIQTESTYVGFVSQVIDDDAIGESSGNSNGEPNPGETIEMRVELENFGTETASDVEGTLTCSDPYVTILDSQESFGDLAGGVTGWSVDDFDFLIDPLCPHDRMIRFDLEISSGTESWHSIIDLSVVSADLQAEGFSLDDGGGNGLFDPGETITLGVALRNEGGADAIDVTGTLSSLSPFITVVDGTGSWGDIPAGDLIENGADRFSLSASPDTYAGMLATMQLVAEFSSGSRDTTTIGLIVGERQADDPIGPDVYGYMAFDDTDVAYPEAPTYEWIEIDPGYGGQGIEVPLSDDGNYLDDSVVIDLPFSFAYYGEIYEKATVCSNGWLAMGSTWLTHYRNWTIPGAGGPDGFLSVFWDDLRLIYGGRVYQYFDEQNHRLIVEWSRVRNEQGGLQTVEIVLYDPDYHLTESGDGIILFQYLDVANTDGIDNYATVGIESPDGRDGLLYTFQNLYPDGAAPLASGRAIRFLPLSVHPTGEFTGQVRNSSFGGAPVEGADVHLHQIDRTLTTDADGRYLALVETGTYTVTASRAGFDPVTVENVEILGGSQTELDFDLVDVAGPSIMTTTQESTSDTLGPYPIPVVITDDSGLGEIALYYRVQGGPFSQLPLLPDGGDRYLAEIPGQGYVAQVDYYVFAEDSNGLAETDPPGASEDVYSFLVTPSVDLFLDDLESENGWRVGELGDDATAGIWERVDPVATWHDGEMVQPEDDHTEAGTLCFVTDGQGGAQGAYDVDTGRTTLTTPLLDLASFGTVVLQFHLWFSNDTGDAPTEDPFVVEASSDAGQTWVPIMSTLNSDRSWRLHEIVLNEFIEITDRVRIRFVASDYGGYSVVEAALDDVALLLRDIVEVHDTEAATLRFSLMPSRPNPSRATAGIAFTLCAQGSARLCIFNLEGRMIRVLLDGVIAAGLHEIVWDGRDERGAVVPSGVYFYRLETAGRVAVNKLMRLD